MSHGSVELMVYTAGSVSDSSWPRRECVMRVQYEGSIPVSLRAKS